jgi:hypothetical protein
MSELGGTEAVRGYHKKLRTAKNIHIPEIYPVAPHIGKGTINDYFGRSSSTQDFKLTTVLAIDRALVAICGKRVGQPPLVGFCPADAADLRERNEALDCFVYATAAIEIVNPNFDALADYYSSGGAKVAAAPKRKRGVMSKGISL